MNAAKRSFEKKEMVQPAEAPPDVKLLMEIRDLLKARGRPPPTERGTTMRGFTVRTSRSKPLTTALKQAIADSQLSFKALERDTGVKRQSLMKFMAGEQSLRLDMADKLASYFGLRLQARSSRLPRKPR